MVLVGMVGRLHQEMMSIQIVADVGIQVHRCNTCTSTIRLYPGRTDNCIHHMQFLPSSSTMVNDDVCWTDLHHHHLDDVVMACEQ